jgi:uncharacterized protein YutE (UPF0331/DUF86 family)
MKKELFLELQKQLEKQIFWLNHSFQKSKNIDLQNISINDFDTLETLSSRFARTLDFLVRKYWRALDSLEFENQGTLVDIVNRAEKRGFFDDIEIFRDMRDLRNEIVHEYLDDNLQENFQDIIEYSELLLEICKGSLDYGK